MLLAGCLLYNTTFRPCEVVHNLKHPVTGEKLPHVVARLPSFGEDRMYAKEQALIDLVREELAAGRPCVVYLRQTATRDIQPRLERLLRQHIPEARPFILKNTVEAERREKVIEQQIERGTNVVLCNPELIKTGLDMLHFPTLIFYELVFNLSTLMQAAARSYRLNQTHARCKVVYMYAEDTMEQTAVQLMSRKQRAAKLLTGDIGLTGLDALTEGEGGLEEALLDAIGRDETLLDPSELFKTTGAVSEIDREDAAYWQVEQAEPEQADPVLAAAVELGATVMVEEAIVPIPPTTLLGYLDSVVLVVGKTWERLQPELVALVTHGASQSKLVAWLTEQRVVFPGFEAEVAAKLVGFGAPVQVEAVQSPQAVTEPPRPVLTVRPKAKPNLIRFPPTDDQSVQQRALL